MRKIGLHAAFFVFLGKAAMAQMSTGGLPLSLQKNDRQVYVPATAAVLPDWNKGLESWEAQADPKPYLVALMTPTDLGFPSSGTLYIAENGVRIWKAKLNVAGAKALGLYYDNFHLPAGVRLFLSNANGKQILGAYTDANNDPGNKFASEAVEGEVINLELNIDPGVALGDISMHIDRAATYFRSIDYLGSYHDLQTIDVWDSQLTGGSSVCMINAVCPLSAGYENQRNATFQTLVPVGGGIGSCSATMVNTATNAPGSCKQYFLLATHCEFSNATTNAGFSQVILRFNYQHSVCNPPASAIPNTQQTMTGAKFVARSVLPVNGQGPIASQIKGDFLLLELKSALPDSWGMNLAGWNNSASIPLSTTAPKKFIGFHHPGGDVKKVSSSHAIQSYDVGASGSHWLTTLDSGLAAEGSSGSALFDGDGRIIGVASLAAVGQGVPNACVLNKHGVNIKASTSNIVMYSKLSYDWDYSVDGSASNRKLKPWLDPNNSNVTTLNTVKSNCSPISGGTGITRHNKLDDALTLFPNPSSTGRITLQINLAEVADLTLDLYDISGNKVTSFKSMPVKSGSYDIDLSAYANGVYLLRITDGYNITSRKVILAK